MLLNNKFSYIYSADFRQIAVQMGGPISAISVSAISWLPFVTMKLAFPQTRGCCVVIH